MEKFKFLALKVFLGVLVVLILISGISTVFNGFTGIYNKTVNYNLEYKALEQNQITTWDNNYLAFKEKYDIANVNKETFITVTSIIMQARTDGPNVAWKWAHENQNIPYEEFTSFYKDLSNFVVERFAENKVIEQRKQEIVKQHNGLITNFPGIVYNHFLKRPIMEYHFGFISNNSKQLFNK